MKPNCIDIWLPQAIDVEVLKKNGIELVCPKASQGAYIHEDGHGYSCDFKDPKFDEHMQKCIKAKIPVMPWHFFTACTISEAKRQAKFFVDALKPYKAYIAYVALDCEVYTMPRQASISREYLTDICIAFMDVCKNAGYKPILYTNPDHVQNKIDEKKLWAYPKWVACYNSKDPLLHNEIIWQYGIDIIPGVQDEYGRDIIVDCNYQSLHEYVLAIMEMAEKGFLQCPAYWIDTAPKIKYLPELFVKANRAYSFRWKQSQKVEWALSKLKEDGVITSPNYWLSVKNKNVKTLLKNLGGGQK